MTSKSWQDYFQPEETLLWEGSPLPGVHQRAKIIGIAIVGLPLLVAGIAIGVAGVFQTFNAQSWNELGLGLFMSTFAIPFAGFGAILVVGQWYAAQNAHRKVRYALSDRCAYISRSYWTHSLKSYPILPSSSTELESCDRWTSVWFHSRKDRDSDGSLTTYRVGFENIGDGEVVFRLIRSLQTRTVAR